MDNDSSRITPCWCKG